MNNTTIIIGAGPAGIIAALTASKLGKKVILLEKNENIGRKLFITGKGRCNITNAIPIEDFFDNIMTNKEFLYSSLYSFTNESIINFLNKEGLETKVERGNRIFPKSDKSSDVIKIFERKIKEEENIDLKLNNNVLDIKKTNQSFIVKTDKGDFRSNSLIIATGGVSYPKTGSDGRGLKMVMDLGHKITKLRPSLVPIETLENYVKDLQGLSLRNVEICAKSMGKEIYKEFGEMVFTHYGISGPIVLSMSTYLFSFLNKDINIFIDLKPALDNEKLDKRILKDFNKYNNKYINNALNDLLPKKIIETVINLADIEIDKPVQQITKEERANLVKIIKNFPLTFKKFRPIEEAIITSGGVDTLEIDSSTMESKLIKNLFFAGEIIDVDALTGGFNLQIAYSTGYLAGVNC